jgi:hypothetical protein
MTVDDFSTRQVHVKQTARWPDPRPSSDIQRTARQGSIRCAAGVAFGPHARRHFLLTVMGIAAQRANGR